MIWFFTSIFWLAYWCIALVLLRPLTQRWAWSHYLANKLRWKSEGKTHPRDRGVPFATSWIVGFIIAAVTAAIWPVMLAWWLVGRVTPPTKVEREAKHVVVLEKTEDLEKTVL